MLSVPKSSFLTLLCIVLMTAGLNAQDIQSPSTDLYQEGVDLYEKGFFEEATSKLVQFNQRYPDHQLSVSADYFLIRAKTGIDSSNIETYYREFVIKHSGHELSERLLRDLGHRFTDQGEYEAAISYYQNAVDSWMGDKDGAETMYWIAEAAAENGDLEDSRVYFMDLANTYPRSEWAPKALYARGRL